MKSLFSRIRPHADGSAETPAWRWNAVLWAGLMAVLAAGVLLMTFRDLDTGRLLHVLREADGIWIALLPVTLLIEQTIRGWKWRQILFDIRPVATLRLFGAVMAGYFANIVLPIGISPLARAWLVARLERLRFTTVLMTTAIERFVDGVVFAVIVAMTVLFATLPGGAAELSTGLTVAGSGGLVVFAALLAGLFVLRDRLSRDGTLLNKGVARLESAFGGRFAGLGDGLSAGIVWPRSRWRGAGVVSASLAMKAVSATHFLWAGLAVGVLLPPFAYLFLLVVVSVSLILARFVRLPGGFIIGGAFGLQQLGVADEEALTITLLVHITSIGTTAAVGAFTFWRSGATLAALRRGVGTGDG